MSWSVALGDLDGDGDLDAFIARTFYEADDYLPNLLFINDGTGRFVDSGQLMGSSRRYAVFLSDLDRDGDLDAFVGNGENHANQIWLNDGTGTFSNSGLDLGQNVCMGLAVNDVDGDGDAFMANYGSPNQVYFNKF